MGIRYEGTVGGFREHAMRELRLAAMRSWNLNNPGDVARLQRRFRVARVRDLRDQVLRSKRGGVA